jgi:hypothetical protein
VNAFFLLYALAISVELLLTLVMAIFIFLIVAPKGGNLHVADEEPAARPLARTVPGALGDAFATVSEGRNDLATITNARSLLARYAREHEPQHEHSQHGTIQS